MMGDKALKLAARCEAADGPDRELDAEICRALGLGGGNPIIASGMEGWLVGSETNPNPVKAPAYTASIDAAMQLVPEEGSGWPQVIYRGPNPNNPPSFHRVELWLKTGAERGRHPTSFALALCAAALKARASSPTPSPKRNT